MKNVIAISLLFIFSLASLKEATMYAFFKINQTSIQELFCINKDAPELKCEGKCHFNAQLAEASDTENEQNAPVYEQLEWHINSHEIETYSSVYQDMGIKNSSYSPLTSAILYCDISNPPQLFA